MPINFPDSPSLNDTHTVGDKTWTWDGTAWTLVQNNVADHGNLGGLADDDHTQYLLADGTRTATELTVTNDLTVDTDTLHVDSTNNRVGIGTTSPSAKLDVESAGVANSPTLSVTTTNSDLYNHAIEALNPNLTAGEGNIIVVGRAGSTKNAGYLGYQYSSAGSDNNLLSLGHWGNNWLLNMKGNGYVGIGTTNPGAPLHLFGAGNAVDQIRISSTGGTVSEYGFLGADASTNVMRYGYWTGSGFGNHHFEGNVGIGTSSPGSMLDVRGGVQTHRILPFSDGTYDLGANVLRWRDVYATNGTIQTSDERDKASITDIDLGLAFVNDLRPVTYTWDDRSGNVGARTHMGFVAQEVATVLGDEASNRAVWIHASAEQTTDPETGEVDEGRDIQGLRYNELMAPMVKAIQELSATVQTLTARIEALEAE